MEREKKDILISDLIYKSLTDALKGNEADILEAWLRHPENAKFYMELKNSGRLYDGVLEMQYADVEEAWQGLSRQVTDVRRRRRWRWIVGCAASLVVAVVGVWLFSGGREETSLPLARAEVLPRQAPVTLKSATGEMVYIEDSVKTLILPKEEKRETPAAAIKKEAGESLLPAERRPANNVLTTSAGSTIEITLYDGTRVWLNAGSELEYPPAFASDRREVMLRGEGYFEVAKDVRRPFIVRTPSARLEVLGTSFNVLASREGECVTTLVEGRVKVADSLRNEVILSPGQQAELASPGSWQVREVDTRYYTAWREGLFAFRDCTLKEIITTLSAWYGATFFFGDSQLASIRYTTMLHRYERVDDVLRILEVVGDFRCEPKGNNIYVIKRK